MMQRNDSQIAPHIIQKENTNLTLFSIADIETVFLRGPIAMADFQENLIQDLNYWTYYSSYNIPILVASY